MAASAERGWTVVSFEVTTAMIGKVLLALGMIGLVAGVHAAGLVIVLRTVVLSKARPRITPRFWSVLWLFVWVPLTLTVIHLLEIGLWGCFFWRQHCFPDGGSSIYFAGASYTTLGYGDLVLPAEWRLFGPLAALTGLLSSGLSVGFFVAVVGAVYQSAIVSTHSAYSSPGKTPPTLDDGSLTPRFQEHPPVAPGRADDSNRRVEEWK